MVLADAAAGHAPGHVHCQSGTLPVERYWAQPQETLPAYTTMPVSRYPRTFMDKIKAGSPEDFDQSVGQGAAVRILSQAHCVTLTWFMVLSRLAPPASAIMFMVLSRLTPPASAIMRQRLDVGCRVQGLGLDFRTL